jgi:hypothetical protein
MKKLINAAAYWISPQHGAIAALRREVKAQEDLILTIKASRQVIKNENEKLWAMLGKVEEEGANLRTLLAQHGTHWAAVANELDGICGGGVDVPVSEPNSTGGAIVTAIHKLTAQRDEARYQVSELRAIKENT